MNLEDGKAGTPEEVEDMMCTGWCQPVCEEVETDNMQLGALQRLQQTAQCIITKTIFGKIDLCADLSQAAQATLFSDLVEPVMEPTAVYLHVFITHWRLQLVHPDLESPSACDVIKALQIESTLFGQLLEARCAPIIGLFGRHSTFTRAPTSRCGARTCALSASFARLSARGLRVSRIAAAKTPRGCPVVLSPPVVFGSLTRV
mmetsp:Transcript_75263/g.130328  ORF Transcript_75263/g.130328 Transcript_75263/m.130328 type:complete len:203 (-) Transcript_75263:187-795(-)